MRASAAGAAATTPGARKVAACMLARCIDLLLFAGGDGTARDVFDVIGDKVPMLGVPTGVKMHSAVFATSPEAAGDVALRFLAGGSAAARLREAEIMDVDEALAAGRARAARLHGYAPFPMSGSWCSMPRPAPRATTKPRSMRCAAIAETARSRVPLCLRARHHDATRPAPCRHRGDAARRRRHGDGRLVGADLGESALLALSEGRKLRIVVGVIGGQGFLFGRGNQEISAEIIGRAGRDGITVVSSFDKLLTLEGQCLFVEAEMKPSTLRFRLHPRRDGTRSIGDVSAAAPGEPYANVDPFAPSTLRR